MKKPLSPHEIERELARRRSANAFLKEQSKDWSVEDCKSHVDQITRWFNKVLDQIPSSDVCLLREHWSKQEVSLPDGQRGTAPCLWFDHWFTSGNSNVGLPAIAGTDGGGLITVDTNLFFAPREVVMSVLAHELVHMLFKAQGVDFDEVTEIPQGVSEVYQPSAHAEETAVRAKLSGWGFEPDLLETWEVAVEEGKENWPSLYKELKRKARIEGL